jgi:hypothetical protein
VTDDRRSSLAPVAPDRTASSAVAERSEPDDARARDVQAVIPGMDTDGDEPELTGHRVFKCDVPEWA